MGHVYHPWPTRAGPLSRMHQGADRDPPELQRRDPPVQPEASGSWASFIYPGGGRASHGGRRGGLGVCGDGPRKNEGVSVDLGMGVVLTPRQVGDHWAGKRPSIGRPFCEGVR